MKDFNISCSSVQLFNLEGYCHCIHEFVLLILLFLQLVSLSDKCRANYYNYGYLYYKNPRHTRCSHNCGSIILIDVTITGYEWVN